MDITSITDFLLDFQKKDISNRIAAELAKKPEYTDKFIYEGVVCGVASACDEVLASLKVNEAANIDLMQPREWLPGAESVISVFMPFARWITEENAGGDWPSGAWLNGRIEGQASLIKTVLALAERICEEGYEAIIPVLDPRFEMFSERCTSNWSERHVAFSAGVGTFGLSRGIITELGVAGRLASIVTTARIEPTPRPYTDLLEYCIRCGACARNCPPNAFSPELIKDNMICDDFINKTREIEKPYYGCGKCQSGMPCSFGVPGKN